MKAIFESKFRFYQQILLAGATIFIALLASQSVAQAAPTTLAPGDLVIVTVASDTNFASGSPCASQNSFDFVPLVDIGSGTTIHFADKAWNGSTNDWRSGGEGKVTYVAPTDISAGTVIRYEDCFINTMPSVWTMDGIPSGSSGNFDPSTSGDNILVFQGDEANPDFIYGIGWARTASWVSSGTPTTNTSYIPPALSTAASTIVDLGARDNYQLQCSLFDPASSSFLANVANSGNWLGDNTTIFPVITETCPQVTVNQVAGQNDPTNVDSAIFEVVFSKPIDPTTFNASDITLSGTSGTVTTGPLQAGPMDDTTFQFTVTGMSAEDTVVASLGVAVVQDTGGNDNSPSTSVDNQVTYDPEAPVITFTTPLTPGATDKDTFTVTITDFLPDATTYVYVLTTSPCGVSTDFSAAEPLVSGASIDIVGDSDNGKYVCVRAEDQPGNISYSRSANPIQVVLSSNPSEEEPQSESEPEVIGQETLAETGIENYDVLLGVMLVFGSLLIYLITPKLSTAKVK